MSESVPETINHLSSVPALPTKEVLGDPFYEDDSVLETIALTALVLGRLFYERIRGQTKKHAETANGQSS